MTTLIAKYTSIKTAAKYNDFSGFTELMNGFGYETRINNAMDVIEVIDPENDNEIVDRGHPIAIKFNGETYYEIMSAEMESQFDLDGQWFDTIFDEVEITNYPAHFRKCMRAARRV